ncbi:PREDICTED: uncharacterized protein LOC108973381 [Bactrocera latifrons]|uniref:Osiris 20 n=1 Tax=Bactrocera latifrons TaxID=174628 RepID=A0A0K8UXF6_BACLA|nr:PREDICTED: uncharacterized protein LOC108973381 [Bactrocera latifrons]
MAFHFTSLIAFGCLLLVAASPINAAAIDNSVAEPRIRNTDELLTTIVDKCFHANGLYCLKEKVLTYLDGVAGVEEDISGRAFNEDIIDKVIVDRVGRILNNNEFRLRLPETGFGSSIVSYSTARGFDVEVPETGARGEKKKDKLLLPLLLLMKLKLKVVMPILLGLIGLKAFKALILSKIAIKLVLGFLIYNLITKLSGAKMMMMPAPMPAAEYGPPSTTASSYDPSSWEPASGGPYARWDSQSLAYSSYHPSSSSYNSGSSSTGSSSSYSSSS